MSTPDKKILAVPTNIITGFLGAGKTTAILHLLKHKPTEEKWAVLVNEFGEIGVDGSMFEGQYDEEHGVFIREVPGGCMCCAAGLPMQIAINQLLSRAKPDRLLIEPTGLGHPKEVLQILSADYNQDTLDLQKIVTLVDARKLVDQRYTNHQTFNQQITIADIIVGNKLDLYQPLDKSNLEQYLEKHEAAQAKLIFTENGEIPLQCLQGKTATMVDGHFHSVAEDKPLLTEALIPECGYIKAFNEGEGFQSVGWRFSPGRMFDRKRIFSFLSGLSAERMKAVLITEQGVFGYNLTSDALTEIELDDCSESRLEIIADNIHTEWEDQLMACLVRD